LKKLLIMLVLTVCTAGLFAQMAKYDRKSISITKMNVSADAKAFATQADVNQIYSELYKRLKGMERFDYNEIPAGITDVNELMKIVKEYTATKIEERAAKQWNIKNEYYGSNFVTGENVDKIMNGAFIMVPTLNSYIITEGKDKEGKQTFTAVMNVKLDVYEGVKNGDAFEAKLSNTVSANGTNASLGIDVSSLLNLPTGKAKDPRKEAVESATNTMLLFLDKEVRKLPMFTIKAFTTKVDPANDKIMFNMGKNVGVKLDDGYSVGFYQGDKFVETGFMKVRKIEQEGSQSQLLIVSNPKGEKESELFNEFDQVIEYPQVGLNIIVGGGMTKYNHYTEPQDFLEGNDEFASMVGSINLNAEYNIAKFVSISELYAQTGFTYLMVPNIEESGIELEINSMIYEAGLKKKFFKRQFGFTLGADFFYHTLSMKLEEASLDEELYSIGGDVNAGINFMFSKSIFLDATAGFRFASQLTDKDGNVSDDDDKRYNPNGFFFKAGIGFTL